MSKLVPESYPFIFIPANKVSWIFAWNSEKYSSKDVSVWNPIPPIGYGALGSFAKTGASRGEAYARPGSADGLIPFVYLKSSAAKEPLRFTEVWNSKGEGATNEAICYRPEPPTGYVTVGDYMRPTYGAATLSDRKKAYCLKKEYVKDLHNAWSQPIWKGVYISSPGLFKMGKPKISPSSGRYIIPSSMRDCCMNEGADCGSDLYKSGGVCDKFMQEYCVTFPNDPVCACLNRPVSNKTGQKLHPTLVAGCAEYSYTTNNLNRLLRTSPTFIDCSIAGDIKVQGDANKVNDIQFKNVCGVFGENGKNGTGTGGITSTGTTSGRVTGRVDSEVSDEDNNTLMYILTGGFGLILFLMLIGIIIIVINK